MSKGNMLQDKVAVVTGAGRGIGRDIALMMAAQGAKVVVNDIGASVGGEGNDVLSGEEDNEEGWADFSGPAQTIILPS